jgi:hypothetical protein
LRWYLEIWSRARGIFRFLFIKLGIFVVFLARKYLVLIV